MYIVASALPSVCLVVEPLFRSRPVCRGALRLRIDRSPFVCPCPLCDRAQQGENEGNLFHDCFSLFL